MVVDKIAHIVSEYTGIHPLILFKSRDSDAVDARRQIIGICQLYGRTWTEIRRILIAFSDNHAVRKAHKSHLERLYDPIAYNKRYADDFQRLLALVKAELGEPEVHQAGQDSDE